MAQDFAKGIDQLGRSWFEQEQREQTNGKISISGKPETPNQIHRRLGQWAQVTDFQIGDTFMGSCGIEVIVEIEPSILMITKKGNEFQAKPQFIQNMIMWGLLKRIGHTESKKGKYNDAYNC